MPQQGERRTAHGETREWNGHGWALVPDAPPEKGYHPGLETSELGAKVKGFASGATEGLGSGPGRFLSQALLALITEGASLPTQIASAGGLEALTELLQVGAKAENAPESLTEAYQRPAEMAAGVGVLGGAMRVPAALRALKAGGADTALSLASHLPGVGKYAKLAQLAKTFAPEAQGAAPAVEAAEATSAPAALNLGRSAPGRAPSTAMPSEPPGGWGPINKEIQLPRSAPPANPEPTIGVKYANAGRLSPDELKELNTFMGGGPSEGELASIRSQVTAPPSGGQGATRLQQLGHSFGDETPFAFEGRAAEHIGEPLASAEAPTAQQQLTNADVEELLRSFGKSSSEDIPASLSGAIDDLSAQEYASEIPEIAKPTGRRRATRPYFDQWMQDRKHNLGR